MSGNVGIGTTSPRKALDVVGAINATTGAITGLTVNATYQDVAEWVPSTQKLAAGTVVVLDTAEANHVLASTKAYDTEVAGMVSESPGVEGGEGKLKVATTGRVRVRADTTRAPIKTGSAPSAARCLSPWRAVRARFSYFSAYSSLFALTQMLPGPR